MLDKFFKLAERKFNINTSIAQDTFPWKDYKAWFSYEQYLIAIKNEVDEVNSEIKKDNSVFLEDELGDIFWNYVNLLYSLENEGYITKERVFKKVFKKFNERIDWLENGITWDEIKNQQKEKRKKEHNKLYKK